MNWKKKILPYQAQPFESLNQEGGEGGGGSEAKIPRSRVISIDWNEVLHELL